jgi:hypothetical protein
MGPQVKPAVSFHVGVTTNHATDVAESSHAMPCHAMPCQYSNCTSDVLLSAIALEFGWLPTHSHIHIRWGVDIGSILGSTKFQVHSGSARLEIEEWNGMEWNGMEWNGMERNGTERNGTERNGTERNGTERNRLASKIRFEGSSPQTPLPTRRNWNRKSSSHSQVFHKGA